MRKVLSLIGGIILLAVFTLAISACGEEKSTTDGTASTTSASGSTSTSANSSVVNISGSAFDPAELTVAVGTTVTWSNNDSLTHTVTASGGAFNSGDMKRGQNFGYTFNEPGTFEYGCTIHPAMQGTVIVK